MHSFYEAHNPPEKMSSRFSGSLPIKIKNYPPPPHIKHMAINTSLQDINWLRTRKNGSMYPVYIKGTMSIVPIYRSLQYSVFIYVLERQLPKKQCKLSTSWLMWVKVTFTNIHKMSNACADSFGRFIKWLIYCTMYEKNI